MKILLTGFDPFNGETTNPALEAVKRVRTPSGVQLIRLEVPTVFGLSLDTVARAMEAHRPDVVLCIGQAGGRSTITPERVAINLMDATIADNRGFIPEDQPIFPGDENALFSTLPVKDMVKAIRQADLPASLSCSAGTFVCNQLLYGVLRLCRDQYPETRAGFIHVPFLPEQTAGKPELPSLPLDRIVKGLEAVLELLSQA